MSKSAVTSRLLLLMIVLTACSPAPAPPTPTAIPPQPTDAEAATPEGESSPLEAGRRYTDTPEDMPVSFLDVTAFQATIHEETETVEVLLRMRDIPETADLGQVKNLIEYSWTVFVYPDPSDLSRNFYLTLNTSVREPSAAANSLTAVPGNSQVVSIVELFQNRGVYDFAGRVIEDVHLDIDTGRNTLLLTGRIPRITSKAVFSFNTTYLQAASDEPDNFLPADSAALSTPAAEIATPGITDPGKLVPIGNVHAFPGPDHYAGDILTFEIRSPGSFDETFTVSMALDGGSPTKITSTYLPYGLISVPMALDTTNLMGRHTLKFTTEDGQLNETYSFDVLPADQRPANETTATWLTKDTDCCTFHYLSDTAAARDIDFIAEHFQNGADELERIVHAQIEARMNVYIIDRIMGNGGFGGGGKLMISYTDRYYGPTIGAAGLEGLARHEFSHASSIGLDTSSDGIDFNYEGLAVYLAGGHYKPEPLAQRGAALFDLGRFAPVDQYIPQHELEYLRAASTLTFIADTYGEAKIWEFLNADDTADGELLPMADAIQKTFGISLEEFNQGFQAWLERNDPGEQLEDLRLTIQLQDLRREYQDIYASQPMFLLLEEVDAVQNSDYRTIVMREARAPANIATELIIANGQQAIIDGDYMRAEKLNNLLAEILASKSLYHPVAKDYLDIVLAAAEKGYEVVNLQINDNNAEARVTADPPMLIDLKLQKIDNAWQIQP